MQTGAMQIVLIGNPTRDRIVRDGKTVNTLGGTVLYAGLFLARSGIPVSIVGKGDKEMLAWIESCGIGSEHFILSQRVAAFENYYGLTGRKQQAQPGSNIVFSEVPQAAYRASGILVGAVLMEVDPRIIISPRSGLLMVDAQGFIRKLEDDGRVALRFNPALEKAISGCDILKADGREAEAITGTNDVRESARRLYQMGPRIVIITLAARGCGIFDGHQWIRIRAPELHVADPTGAGDVFDAAFLAEYLRAEDVITAGCCGTVAASLTVAGLGTAAVPSAGQVRQVIRDRYRADHMVVVERLIG
jgi:sugar/nucleoside kinase (ribokinase family)